jgi:hypothetical protein
MSRRRPVERTPIRSPSRGEDIVSGREHSR